MVKARGSNQGGDYTREEMVMLASLRRGSGRTCEYCEWFSVRGKQRGCFPNGEYRKWLSYEEYSSGCDTFLRLKD
jgi:hypothetical protein